MNDPCQILTDAEREELAHLIAWWQSGETRIPELLIPGRFPWSGPAVGIGDADQFRASMDRQCVGNLRGWPEANLYYTLQTLTERQGAYD